MTERRDGVKRAYQKPAIRKVELASDEVLGSGCKTSTTPVAPLDGNVGCVVSNCSSTNGS